MIIDHEFGNGSGIFTRDENAAREFAHQIQVRDGRNKHSDSGPYGISLFRRLEANLASE